MLATQFTKFAKSVTTYDWYHTTPRFRCYLRYHVNPGWVTLSTPLIGWRLLEGDNIDLVWNNIRRCSYYYTVTRRGYSHFIEYGVEIRHYNRPSEIEVFIEEGNQVFIFLSSDKEWLEKIKLGIHDNKPSCAAVLHLVT